MAAGTLAVISLIADLFKAKAEADEASIQEQVEKFNASLAEQRAGLIRANNALSQLQARKRLKLVTGKQRALFSKAGVTFSGSPNNVIEDTISELELDISLLSFNNMVKAKGFESEAEQRRTAGRQALRRGQLRVGQTLLTSVGGFGSKFLVSDSSAGTPAKEKIGE